MILCKKTLECLREMINEKSEYRSGPKLVQFFNDLGFSESYGQGLPSRWFFTDERLAKINGTPALDQCIRNTFAPVNFVGRIQELDLLIKEFNQYLAFDKWKVVRQEADIGFQKLEKVEIESGEPKDSENEFLSREFTNVDLTALQLESAITDVLQLWLAAGGNTSGRKRTGRHPPWFGYSTPKAIQFRQVIAEI